MLLHLPLQNAECHSGGPWLSAIGLFLSSFGNCDPKGALKASGPTKFLCHLQLNEWDLCKPTVKWVSPRVHHNNSFCRYLPLFRFSCAKRVLQKSRKPYQCVVGKYSDVVLSHSNMQVYFTYCTFLLEAISYKKTLEQVWMSCVAASFLLTVVSWGRPPHLWCDLCLSPFMVCSPLRSDIHYPSREWLPELQPWFSAATVIH